MQIVSPDLLVLTRLRGNIPLLAALDRGAMGYNALAAASGLSRDSLSRSLRALQRPRWVRRLEGPSAYRLSPRGQSVAAAGAAVLDAAMELKRRELLLKRWSLPIAAALRNWSLRFGELREMLPGVTPRALTLALKELQAAGLVEREVEMTFPPSTAYRLSPRAETLLPPLLRI